MQTQTIARSNSRRYGSARRSILRNLRFSMLAFGLAVGLVFPFFAYFVLNSGDALKWYFFLMCVAAGLMVGTFNFFIFRVVVSRELIRIQQGMHHVNENIATMNLSDTDCENNCQLQVTSADIIGDITLDFNQMTTEIFNRLMLEGETKALNEDLIRSVNLEDIARKILRRMADVVAAKGGLIYCGSEGNMELKSNFGIDTTDEPLTLIEKDLGPVNHALSSGEVLVFSKEEGWELFSQTTPFGKVKPNAIVLVPLLANQSPVGLVVLASGIQQLDEAQAKKLEALRNLAAPQLQNAMLHQRITDLAAIDDLTQILNRRFGMRRLKEEFSRATRHGTPMSVLMMDIDHFKNFNDTFGHNAGDAVLKVVASILEKNVRAEDMACRYGGEEFMVMLSGAGMNDSAMAAERFRRLIEAETVRWGGSNLSITMSIGSATYPIVRSSVPEELINYADKALYEAKEAGRNRVMVNDGVRMIPFGELEISDQPKDQRPNK